MKKVLLLIHQFKRLVDSREKQIKISSLQS